jgi:hypothetical protein
MRIEDFPRPKDDNGRGVHWSARIYHDAVQPSLDYWVDQLVAMSIKWVKVLDDGGGSALNLCRKLLAADIMPVVRLYLAQLNPSRLGGREMDTVSRMVDAGVRYFESNNEPDLPAEWRENRLPNDWLDIVVNNFIRDADGVLARGGLLALPAMGPGSRDNPVSLVVQKGRKDLFERGCWVAIHNYTLNHPLDYPDDGVNQAGRPLTPDEFAHYAAWAYSHLSYEQIAAQGADLSAADYNKYQNWAWDGRNMQMVNDLRAASKNPGATVHDDPNCFRGWEAAGKMIHDALGFYVPVISTEGGPVVGWGDDKRYAKVNPQTQMEWQLDIMRFMQSQAPSWYFSCCTWLVASRPLGDFNPSWEQMSWYTHVWDIQFGLDGQLPIIQALKAEPSVIRPELRLGQGTITGVVRRPNGDPAADLPLRLVGESRDIAAVTDQTGAYRFEGLADGVYSLLSGDSILANGLTLAASAAIQHDLTLGRAEQSAIGGLVADTAGQPQRAVAIILRRGQDAAAVAEAQTGGDGRYRFTNLPAGSYWVSTEDASVAGIVVDGWNVQTVDLTTPAPPGYRFAVVTQRLLSQQETGNDRKFYGQVLDEAGNGINGVTVEMAWLNAEPGTQLWPRQTTPKDPFKPSGNFEFLHSPGEFILRVIHGEWPSDEAAGLRTTGIPNREGDPITYEVNFQLTPLGDSAGTGRISGVITNAAGLGLTLWLGQPATGSGGQRSWGTVVGDDSAYSFDGLPAGQYRIELEGKGVVGEISLAEGEAATFNTTAPDAQPTLGALAGTVTLHDGQPATNTHLLLYHADSFIAEAVSDLDGHFHFDGLEPGTYRLNVAALGAQANDVVIKAGETTSLELRLPAPDMGSALLGTLLYSNGQPAAGLSIWLVSRFGAALPATTSGPDGAFAFSRLAADSYDLFVEHPTAGPMKVRSELIVNGVDSVTLTITDLAPPAKPLATYLLFGSTRKAQLQFELTLPHVRKQGLTAGFSLEDAKHAAIVTIVGGEDVISSVGEQELRAAGCQVERLASDPFTLAEALQL